MIPTNDPRLASVSQYIAETRQALLEIEHVLQVAAGFHVQACQPNGALDAIRETRDRAQSALYRVNLQVIPRAKS